MTNRHYRVLIVASHPVQYMAPLLRRMAAHPALDLQVVYCKLQGAQAGHDPEFGTNVQWDMPLLDGYRWSQARNRGSGGETFFGLLNPELWSLIRQGNFDAVLCFTGYLRATFWIALLAAKISKTAFLFGTDTTTLAPRDGRPWKAAVKKIFWPRLFHMADQVVVPSSASRDVILSLGIPGERITLTPFCVDNDWWIQQSSRVDRAATRAAWGASPKDFVILFCAKLQPWKRPIDLLRAFAKEDLSSALLVFAGEGPLRSQLESEASALGIAARVRFLGFVNQSQLPAVYTSADVMVLPSEYEPFAVVVNEAMCCGCPVLASDQVGAARDLVAPVAPQFVFSCGDSDALAAILKGVLSAPAQLHSVALAGREHIQSWSPERNIAATVEAIRAAVTRAGRGSAAVVSDAATTTSSSPAAAPKLRE
jgi:glycosyltransferase involved in cell wall biosynthesis